MELLFYLYYKLNTSLESIKILEFSKNYAKNVLRLHL